MSQIHKLGSLHWFHRNWFHHDSGPSAARGKNAPLVFLLVAFLMIGSARTLRAPPSGSQATFDAVIKSVKFREIGPAIMGGRADDVAVVERDPRIVYVGLAGGGLWKT